MASLMGLGSSSLALAGLLFLTACATPYQARGLTGGFTDTRLDANTFRVEFLGNGYTPRAQVESYLLRRAAEVTLANGFDYFVLLDAGTERNVSVVTTPGTYQATTTGSAYAIGSRAYGSATTVGTYTPGISIPVSRYGGTAILKAFRGEKPAHLVSAFDAREVLQYQGVAAPPASRPAVSSLVPSPQGTPTSPGALGDEWSGTYAGTIVGEQAGQRVTMRLSATLVRQGDGFTGTWATGAGTSGTLSGSLVQPNLLTLRVKQLTPCPGEFDGTAQLTVGAKIVGSYAGRGCGGDVQASFDAVRQ